MKEYAKAFYKSQAWKDCRAGYYRKVGGLCELCLQQGLYTPGEIVHHKIHITPENIQDPSIVLSYDNLQLLCRKHHAEIHERKSARRYVFDSYGNVICKNAFNDQADKYGYMLDQSQ